jgi:biotin operon repressor
MDRYNLPIPPDSITKSEKIRNLLVEGNHSTKSIARTVGTTEAYVWKEKSKLKSRGLLISRETEEIVSKTSHESLSVTTSPANAVLEAESLRRSKYPNIHSNSTLLNLPQLDTNGLKKLYSDFDAGMKPAVVIAENGFHPELVENEYQRFSRLTEHDIDALIRKFFLDFNQQIVTANNAIKPLVEKYSNKGKFTIDEFITLIRLMLNEKYQAGNYSVINNIKNGIPPDGWEVVRCMNCNKSMSGAIVNAKEELGAKILNTPWTHLHCKV